ncbi:MAG TPA: ATP-binding protein, partial [Gemmatimonadaceae bacterium]
MATIASQEQRLELSHAVIRLCDAILRADTTTDVLQSLVDIAGPALRLDRALIYDVRLNDGCAVALCEWLNTDADVAPIKDTYPLDLFGTIPWDIARDWAPFESSDHAVHPMVLRAGVEELLHGQMGVRRMLSHPLRKRADGYYFLFLNQVVDDRPWTSEERTFVNVVAANVDLALMKLDLLRDRERAVAELATSESRLRVFFDSAPSMFFTVDREGIVRSMNDYATLHLGYAAPDLLGQSVLKIVHPDDRATVQRHLRACFEDPGTISELSFRKICRDGSIMWVKESMRVADGPDGVTAFIACDDITEARAHEEAARQAESKAHDRDEFMAMLGHELRNPLTPIVTALDIMRRRGHDDSELEVIDRQVSHLRRLVDDLLDISRITRGKVELNLEHVEFSTVAAQAVEVARPLFYSKRQTLHVDIPQRGLLVVADRTRLVQAFANLLNNAAKFSGEGQRIYLSAERCGDRIVAEVRDHGEGIEPEMLDRVFDLFVQRGQPADRAQSGLGLGLTIVRNLITLHGGTVRASSEGRGKGTVVVVDLPYVSDAPELKKRNSGETEGVAPSTGIARSVLIVDDNDDVRKSLCRLLDLYGYHTVGAGDGPSAL